MNRISPCIVSILFKRLRTAAPTNMDIGTSLCQRSFTYLAGLTMLVALNASFTAATAACQDDKETSPPSFEKIMEATRDASSLNSPRQIDFNHDIRPILSNRCFACHGPDEATVESGLRLDTHEHATTPGYSGLPAIDLNQTHDSELLRRIQSRDPSEQMPPPGMGDPLTADQVELLKEWIRQGANYAKHWSFAPLQHHVPPALPKDLKGFEKWDRSAIDTFIAEKLTERNWIPNPEADRRTLLRRVYLDLIGLPPTAEAISSFLGNNSPEAYEQQVDELLASPAFGEHWGRKWLDLARYADSAGYADDPLRTIWGYRDWVIQAINHGMPFDQFTTEQIAGDLLPSPTPEQLVATAFHRNTMTNNEGGTNDEEFRNAAVVDRVNTTFSVWMGLTMACAQCHSHKYDPIPHEDYFKIFAIFNQSKDADKTDESPTFPWLTPQQRELKAQLETEIVALEKQLNAPLPDSKTEFLTWINRLTPSLAWGPTPSVALGESTSPSKEKAAVQSNATSPITLQFQWIIDSYETLEQIKALKVQLSSAANDPKLRSTEPAKISELSSDGQNPSNILRASKLAITSASLNVGPVTTSKARAQYLRIEIPGSSKMVSLAEVEVFQNGKNIARNGKAYQSSTGFGGNAERAIDGNRDGDYAKNSVSHTAVENSPWWELDLQSLTEVDSITIWNRTDNALGARLAGAKITLFDTQRSPVFQHTLQDVANENQVSIGTNKQIPLTILPSRALLAKPVIQSRESNDPASQSLIKSDSKDTNETLLLKVGPVDWQLLRPKDQRVASEAIKVTLQITLSGSQITDPLIIGVSTTSDSRFDELVDLPEPILQQIIESAGNESQAINSQALQQHFSAHIATKNQELREKLRSVKESLINLKPLTQVPIMQELAQADRRPTHVQLRGNYKELGDQVAPGFPSALHQYHPPKSSKLEVSRLDLANWINQSDNPLTPRVIVNRYWEEIFGTGLVSTSEDFGSQGALPSHPELLDYLANEFVQDGWDTKRLLRSIVLSQAYKQSSQTSREHYERDPDNVYLARGPRIRPSAEVIRDSTLAVSGLLTNKMLGPPVRPLQPNLGLNAAFGSKTDWETSSGADRYRRAIYTQWRRSSPYASMSTFDAPNREVCILKRDRTNTPLQALVTLNDPTYVEAAQMLARQIVLYEQRDSSDEDKVTYAFSTVLGRPPTAQETQSILKLHADAYRNLEAAPDAAMELATIPLGPLPQNTPAEAQTKLVIELATWTAICNTLLNLDEFLVKL